MALKKRKNTALDFSDELESIRSFASGLVESSQEASEGILSIVNQVRDAIEEHGIEAIERGILNSGNRTGLVILNAILADIPDHELELCGSVEMMEELVQTWPDGRIRSWGQLGSDVQRGIESERKARFPEWIDRAYSRVRQSLSDENLFEHMEEEGLVPEGDGREIEYLLLAARAGIARSRVAACESLADLKRLADPQGRYTHIGGY